MLRNNSDLTSVFGISEFDNDNDDDGVGGGDCGVVTCKCMCQLGQS